MIFIAFGHRGILSLVVLDHVPLIVPSFWSNMHMLFWYMGAESF
jgi:hypothetical protein